MVSGEGSGFKRAEDSSTISTAHSAALLKIDYSAESLPPLEEEPLLPMVEVAAKASDDRKAGNIFAFRLSHLSEIATFMLLVEGNSRPQIQAIANSIEDEVLLEFKESPIKQVR